MSSPTELFEQIATQLQRHPGITRNRRGSLLRDGVRAMTSRGAIVVKLDPERVRALVQAGVGTHYKQQANAWLELGPDAAPETCWHLVEESLGERVPE